MKATHKTLADFHQDREKLFEKGLEDIDSLSADERIWFTIESLIGAVDNGGLISHYYNSDADYNQETIQDLHTLGFPDIADLLARVNTLFPGGQPSKDIEERNEVIDHWPEGKYDDLLDRLDKLFYEKEKALENRLLLHIETKLSVIGLKTREDGS